MLASDRAPFRPRHPNTMPAPAGSSVPGSEPAVHTAAAAPLTGKPHPPTALGGPALAALPGGRPTSGGGGGGVLPATTLRSPAGPGAVCSEGGGGGPQLPQQGASPFLAGAPLPARQPQEGRSPRDQSTRVATPPPYAPSSLSALSLAQPSSTRPPSLALSLQLPRRGPFAAPSIGGASSASSPARGSFSPAKSPPAKYTARGGGGVGGASSLGSGLLRVPQASAIRDGGSGLSGGGLVGTKGQAASAQ